MKKTGFQEESGFSSVIAEPGEEISGLLLLGIAEQLLGSPLLTDDAPVHVDHMIAHIPGKGHLVGHH